MKNIPLDYLVYTLPPNEIVGIIKHILHDIKHGKCGQLNFDSQESFWIREISSRGTKLLASNYPEKLDELIYAYHDFRNLTGGLIPAGWEEFEPAG